MNTRPSNAVNRSPRNVPGGLVPFVTRITINHHRSLSMFKGSCPAPSNANIHSCVRIVSLTSKRVTTLGAINRGSNLRVCGLNANGNSDILRVIRTFTRTSNGPIPCALYPHHTNSVTRY